MQEIGKNSSGHRHSALSFACVQTVSSVGQLSAALRGLNLPQLFAGARVTKGLSRFLLFTLYDLFSLHR